MIKKRKGLADGQGSELADDDGGRARSKQVDAMTAFFLGDRGEVDPKFEAAFKEAVQVSEIDQEIEHHRQLRQKARTSAESDDSDRRIAELENHRKRLLWPQPEDHGSAATASFVRTTIAPRRDVMRPIIELAQSQCRNPKDRAEVWSRLLDLAAAKEPPLLGSTEEGLQYRGPGNELKILSRDALTKRLKR